MKLKLKNIIKEQNIQPGEGCSDPAALNYDPNANGDSQYGAFICQYDYGCANFSQWALQLHGLAVLNEQLNGITFPNQAAVNQGLANDPVAPNEMEDYICNVICNTSVNINPGQYCPACWAGQGGFDFDNPMNSYNIGLSMCTCCQDVPIEGCTDPTSENYNPEASIDDGSCIYPTTNYSCMQASIGGGVINGNCVLDENGPYSSLEECEMDGCSACMNIDLNDYFADCGTPAGTSDICAGFNSAQEFCGRCAVAYENTQNWALQNLPSHITCDCCEGQIDNTGYATDMITGCEGFNHNLFPQDFRDLICNQCLDPTYVNVHCDCCEEGVNFEPEGMPLAPDTASPEGMPSPEGIPTIGTPDKPKYPKYQKKLLKQKPFLKESIINRFKKLAGIKPEKK